MPEDVERRSPARWLLAAPLALYLALFLGYPTFYALRMALTDGITGIFPSAVNLRVLAGDRLFWTALWGNVAIPALSVALELAAGVGLALLLSMRVPARRLVRAAVVIPFALPEIVFLTIMRAILAPRGYANGALAAVGVPPVDFLVPGRVLTYLTGVGPGPAVPFGRRERQPSSSGDTPTAAEGGSAVVSAAAYVLRETRSAAANPDRCDCYDTGRCAARGRGSSPCASPSRGGPGR